MTPSVKPFRLKGEDYAEVVLLGSHDGPIGILVGAEEFLTPKQARLFAAWLLVHAEKVAAHNRAQKKIQAKKTACDQYECNCPKCVEFIHTQSGKGPA